MQSYANHYNVLTRVQANFHHSCFYLEQNQPGRFLSHRESTSVTVCGPCGGSPSGALESSLRSVSELPASDVVFLAVERGDWRLGKAVRQVEAGHTLISSTHQLISAKRIPI